MTVEWVNGRPEDVFAKFYDQRIQMIRQSIATLVAYYTPQIENWMKENAMWVDHTGNARQKLFSDYEILEKSILITIGHGVDYGFFLEIVSQGKYSIIRPALDYFSPKIWSDIRKIMEG